MRRVGRAELAHARARVERPEEDLLVVAGTSAGVGGGSAGGQRARPKVGRRGRVQRRDAPSRDDESGRGREVERADEVRVARQRAQALARRSVPHLDAGEKGRTRVQGQRKVGRRSGDQGHAEARGDARLVVAAADDPALLEADAREPALVPFEPALKRARREVPQADAAVARGRRERVPVERERVDRARVQVERVQERVRRSAAVDEDRRVLGAASAAYGRQRVRVGPKQQVDVKKRRRTTRRCSGR